MKIIDKYVIVLIADSLEIIFIIIIVINIIDNDNFFFFLTINVFIKALIIKFNRLVVLLNDLFELQIFRKIEIHKCIFYLHIFLETISIFSSNFSDLSTQIFFSLSLSSF